MTQDVPTDGSQLIVKHLDQEYNLSRFCKFHPGGVNTLAQFNGKDIRKQMMETQHNKAAYSLLGEYTTPAKAPDIDEEQIDWAKPLVKQVGSLGARYHCWIERPVDRRARLFSSHLLESLSVVKWYVVPLFWIPVSFIFVYISHLRLGSLLSSQAGESEVVYLTGAVGVGFLLWPLVEYSVHRWMFHFKPPDSSPLLITLHFCLHGLHHKTPFDERRLLFPPVPLAMISAVVYLLYLPIFPHWATPAVFAGTIAGYIAYDITHFYLHYGSPAEGSYMYFMKRYHNQHHFVHHNKGFGITSHIWDKILDTVITLRKLKYTLKW